MDTARESAIGASITAEALFDIASVSSAAAKYITARTTRGPKPAKGTSSEFDAQRPRDKVVIPAAFDLHIRGDSRQGDAGQHRYQVGNCNDDQSPGKPGTAHNVSVPKKQNDAENRENTRGEHAGKSPELAGVLIVHRVFRCHRVISTHFIIRHN